jgi:hypothetical protein
MSLMRGAGMARPTLASCACDLTRGVAAANNPALATDFNKSRRCIDIANPHTPSTALIGRGSAARKFDFFHADCLPIEPEHFTRRPEGQLT